MNVWVHQRLFLIKIPDYSMKFSLYQKLDLIIQLFRIKVLFFDYRMESISSDCHLEDTFI